MPSAYSMLVHSCEETTWLRRKAPNLYVVIQQEGQAVQRTGVIKRERAPTWKYICNLSSDSPIILRLWHDSLLRCRDVSLGVVRTDINTLRGLTVSDGEFIKLRLTGESREAKDKHTGTLLVQLVQNTAAASVAMELVQQNVGKLAQTTPAAPAGPSTPASATFETGLNLLITKLDVVVKIGDELAKIHPYANAAWKILTSVYQAVKTQQDTEEKLCKLVDTMNMVYSFTKEADDLVPHLKSLEDRVLPIIKQTVECAMFIREYTGHGFASRAIRNTWDNTDKTIHDLSETMLKLKDSLESSVNVQTAFLSMQVVALSTEILQKVDSLVQSEALKGLNPAEMNATSRPICLKGTRVQLLNEITEWLMTPTGSSILWLSGVAGSGKSTIATTISLSFRGLSRLGAFLFFDRNNPSRSHPDHVIHTLAYFLARSNPHIGFVISAVLQKDPDIVTTPLQTQFERLILEPLQVAEQFIQGPILIILDALDECGDPSSRRNLLFLISTEFPKLPGLFRVLITGRREADLNDCFATRFVEKSIATAASVRDVQLFIQHEVEHIREKNKIEAGTWPKGNQVQAIVSLAGGLFIWAATAIRFIDGYRPNDRMETLIAGKLTNLDTLYSFTLGNSAPWDDTTFTADARAVLACIVFGKIPMTDGTIDVLLGSNLQSAEVLKHLGCLIQWKPGCVARVIHASFADYLTDTLRSEGYPWAINSTFGHHTLGSGCLRILNSQLKFNICGLKDSHILNVDVPDILSLVTNNISPPLSYSSRFWGAHIANCPFDQMILEDIRKFFQIHFLFWVEVLSLLDQVIVASAALAAARSYLQSHDEDLNDLIIDTTKFVSAFAQLIAQSAPHIYLSAVPFAPRESMIAKQLKRWLPNTVGFDGRLGSRWPAIRKVLQGHKDVGAVAFSPDGLRLASGGDKTVCVWDVETGVLAAGPFAGHTGRVNCIHFAQDGTQITSGDRDGTFYVWDAQTGAVLAGPFTATHIDRVEFFHVSPDGARIVSGSRNNQVCVWDTHTGELLAGPFLHYSYSALPVCFSPDSMYIASGSSDMWTICIWDAQTGVLAAECKVVHKGRLCDRICSLDFSPDGGQIASGFEDGSVCVWDLKTNTLVTALMPHKGRVETLCFSPDGTQIVSGSLDRTVGIWDARTGVTVTGPFTGSPCGITSVCYSADGMQIGSSSIDDIRIWNAQAALVDVPEPFWIKSVDFSPDGNKVVSGSFDKMIWVWDAHTGVLLATPWRGHTRPINSVHFSPDGTQVASGGKDSSVRIWDAQTGALPQQPFALDLVFRRVPQTPTMNCSTMGNCFCPLNLARPGVRKLWTFSNFAAPASTAPS